jgi:Protein of unknown function (DUF4239)
MAELIRPLLNGPVTFSVSILFGTLVAMTIQTLYNRQETIHKSLVTCTEEIRQLSLFVNGFPEPYERQAKLLVESFVSINVQELSEGNLTPDSLRSQTEMESLVLLLNKLSSDSHITRQPASLGQAYGCIQRIQAVRTELMATVFSSAHYVTICILACTLLFVFLLETDQEAMQFLVGFQLSLCWSLLIGTYSMLGVIIFDLSTPFTGVFSVMKGTEGDLERASAYALAKDRLLTNDPTD